MLLLNKIKTDLNLTRNEFIYGLVTTTRRLERLAAQVEVTYKFCAAPKEAARVAVINPPSVRNMKKMWVVKDNHGQENCFKSQQKRFDRYFTAVEN
jgi:hypothetical protein